MVDFLSAPNTQNYSARAANDAYCVADQTPEAYNGFVTALFGTYQEHGGKGIDNAALTQLAHGGQRGVGRAAQPGHPAALLVHREDEGAASARLDVAAQGGRLRGVLHVALEEDGTEDAVVHQRGGATFTKWYGGSV